MTQTLTAFFDSRTEAEATIAKLVDAGIPRSSIGLMPGADAPAYSQTGTGSYDYRKDEGGFWSGLKDLFLPEDDRAAYAEGMSRGGLTLSVVVDDAHIERASDILETDSVDFDAREASWRQEGWKGYEAPAAGAAAAYDTAAVGITSTTHGATLKTSGNSAAYAASGATLDQGRTTATGVAGDEVIPLAEETLRVGKRQVSHGRVRVRSYVVETPVEEQVRLREERVNIDRRAVDRPATDADQLFRERSIELEERAEEALVAKDVRVREEVRLGKEANERVQTVSDTVRRTEVEVEDERLEKERMARGTTGERVTEVRRDVDDDLPPRR